MFPGSLWIDEDIEIGFGELNISKMQQRAGR
jgi:hypothetical protein